MLHLIVVLGCLELLSYKMVSSVAIEDKQLEMESIICDLPAEELNDLVEHLEIPLVNYTSKSGLTVTEVLLTRECAHALE